MKIYTSKVMQSNSRSDDGDAAFALGISKTLDATGALVERRESRAEVGRVAALGRHLGQTTGNLAQRLGPARRRVGHHRHVVTHVAEVLRQRDACDVTTHDVSQHKHTFA